MILQKTVKLRKNNLKEAIKTDFSNYKARYLKENYPYIYEAVKIRFNSSQLIDSFSDALRYLLVLTGNKKDSNRYLRKIFELAVNNKTMKELPAFIDEYKNSICTKIRAKKYENYINENLDQLQFDKDQAGHYQIKINHIIDDYFNKPDFFNMEMMEEAAAHLSFIARELLTRRKHLKISIKNVERPHRFDHLFWSGRGYSIGYIYILTNLYNPGLVKIGVTKNLPIERANELSRGKLEREKILNFFLNEYGERNYAEFVAETLSRITGVPGDFNLEYCRKTLIDYPLGHNGIFIEIFIHDSIVESLRDKLELFDENLSHDLYHKEFFLVPSTKYAIIFVDKTLDDFDFLLKQKELIHLASNKA